CRSRSNCCAVRSNCFSSISAASAQRTGSMPTPSAAWRGFAGWNVVPRPDSPRASSFRRRLCHTVDMHTALNLASALRSVAAIISYCRPAHKSSSRLIFLISCSAEEVAVLRGIKQVTDVGEGLAEGLEGSGGLLAQQGLEF